MPDPRLRVAGRGRVVPTARVVIAACCLVVAGCAMWSASSGPAVSLMSAPRGSDGLLFSSTVGLDSLTPPQEQLPVPSSVPPGTAPLTTDAPADPPPADPPPADPPAVDPLSTDPLPAPAPASPPVAAPAPLSSASARAVEGVSSSQLRDVASRALGLIAYNWQNSLPGWEVRFLDARAGYRGLTYPDSRVIELYLRANDTPSSLAHVLAHELGHAVDVTWFDDGDRAAWLSTRGLDPSTPWFPASGAADFSSGAGDFAESFAWWQVGPPSWFGDLAPPPTELQLSRLAQLVLNP